jgi:flavin-dependent dehydrogenase
LIYDIAIVGAGPAGSQAAFILENTGYEFLVLDKEKFPRPKPCAGILPPRIFSELSIPEEIIERPLDGYRVHSPSGLIVESEFPKPGAIVRRDKFDDLLVKRLKRKPELTHVVGFEIKEHCVELKGRDTSIEAKIVIGSDGANSIFLDHMKKNVPIDRRSHDFALGVQYEVSLPEETI